MDKDKNKSGLKQSTGWILIHRKITDHWTWENDKYFKRWITILLYVNHSPKEFVCGNELHTCQPGSSYRSLAEWSRLFKTNKKQVKNFFDLLQKDKMILCQILGKGNQRKHLLTVVNWKEYQIKGTENGTRKVPEMEPERYPEQRKIKEEINNESNKPPVTKEPVLPKVDFIDCIIKKFTDTFPDHIITTPGIERSSAGQLAKLWKELHPGLNTEETLESMRAFFVRCKSINNTWYRDNMSLKTIHSKYTMIVRMLNKGGQRQDLSKMDYESSLSKTDSNNGSTHN
jgi:hypothetical protein